MVKKAVYKQVGEVVLGVRPFLLSVGTAVEVTSALSSEQAPLPQARENSTKDLFFFFM